LTIDSPGGDVAAALRLYRALRAHAAPVSAHAERADSAALLPLLAADLRTASQQARFLVHAAAYPDEYSVAGQTATAMRNSARHLDMADQQITNVITSRSRYRARRLRADMAAETALDSEQARLFGIVHRLIPAEKFHG
jgi:ATP-dependent protease ClpP protease subunit